MIMHLPEFLENVSDSRVKNWFMMDSIWYPLLIMAAYLYFIKKLGPQIMKNHKPLDLKAVMIVYNMVQVFINGYFVVRAFRLLWLSEKYKFFCIEIDYSDEVNPIQIARTIWMYHISRLIDLLETVFFVLRKKDKQATFLHIYHHLLIYFMSWIIVKYFAGGHVAFFGTVNCFVHTIMYTYYLLTATIYSGNKSAVWWKKYLTQLQMIQFVVVGLHAVVALFDRNCTFPKALIMFAIPLDVFMFLLFWNFYKRTYLRKNHDQITQNNAFSGNKIK